MARLLVLSIRRYFIVLHLRRRTFFFLSYCTSQTSFDETSWIFPVADWPQQQKTRFHPTVGSGSVPVTSRVLMEEMIKQHQQQRDTKSPLSRLKIKKKQADHQWWQTNAVNAVFTFSGLFRALLTDRFFSE